MDFKEVDLLQEVQLGNLKAFDILFKRFYAPLCLYATDILGKKHIAEEIVQDVFLKFWNNRATIQIKSSLRSYLYRMVHNHALNYIRDNSSLINNNEIFIDDMIQRSQILDIKSSENILEELISQQIEEELSKAIFELSPQCQQIFRMARFQQLTYSEIASKLGISVSTVKSQMLRSIEKLKITLNSFIK